MKYQLGFPYWSMWGLPLIARMKDISEAGFQIVEILLTQNVLSRFNRWQDLAKKYGLRLHWHQAWSMYESLEHFNNYVFNFLGMLPREGYKLEQAVPLSKEPVVIFPDRYWEARYLENTQNYWVQSTSVRWPNGTFRMEFGDFIGNAEKFHFPVVFDTQHIIEYYQNRFGSESLPQDGKIMMDILEKTWMILGSQVKEIHLNDADPDQGHTRGANVFPGEGKIPLRDFCRLVKESRWEGSIITEVSPFHLGLWHKRIGKIPGVVKKLFD